MTMMDAVDRAVKNIATFGDTDVFPFLFERHIFYDRPDDCKALLEEIHTNFESWINEHPPTTHESLTQVGYTGFRWATQIEPFWNAYYLALVVSIADQIEQVRIPAADKSVFSYRFGWNESDHKLFMPSSWLDYRRRCVELCESGAFVVLTDIADFYPRIYHHRLENELNRLPAAGDVPSRIMRLLGKFSKNVSYGLPIGGPASRILAELSLNATDKLLRANRIAFCRYADDYCLFCDDKSAAYNALVLLSETLFMQGLVLQKNKTKILTSAEFYDMCQLVTPKAEVTTDEEKLLNISIRFDPYSETANDDYEALANAVREVNVVNILAKEVAKTAIDTTVTKQAINALRALELEAREGAIRTLLDSSNIEVLSPVFVTLMRALRAVYDDLTTDSKHAVDASLLAIYDNHKHILNVEVNLAYYLQALAGEYSLQKERLLVEVYQKKPSPILHRIIIGAMANWRCHHWLSSLKSRYSSMHEWEKRAVILASYMLTDEGKHWRDHHRYSWNRIEQLIRDWYSSRFQTRQYIPL